MTYNQEHPDYYERETEMCEECEEEFPTHNGIDFYCTVSDRQHNFCCETCMIDSCIYYFNIAHFRYAGIIEDFIFDNDFTCSHPELFESEWRLYQEHVEKMTKLG